MFEVILVGFFIYYIYRLYSRRKIQNTSHKKTRPFQTDSSPKPNSQSRVIEEMKRCPACGTFNPKSYALYFEGEYFCSMDCRNQRN